MTSKKKPQPLSPENYIRQRSRHLPLGKCWINESWQECRLAQILVTRNHNNGNKTFCVFMVDLYCLGIKNTLWQFNKDEADFDEFYHKMNSALYLTEISYPLAHNIIFAGLEYADELGFKPHKDFTNITEYFLEEDTDDIELIDIECGKDGKPLFVQGPEDTPAKVKTILGQLERVTGPDGFHYIISGKDDAEDFEDEENENFTDEGLSHFIEERTEDFFRLSDINRTEISEEDMEELKDATDDLYNLLFPMDASPDFTILWEDEMNIKISSEKFTNEMLGLDKNIIITEEDKELLSTFHSGNKGFLKPLKKLEDKWGDFAYGAFARQQSISESDSKKAMLLLDEALGKYPDNAILKMEKYSTAIGVEPENYRPFGFKTFFENRNEITGYEMFKYQTIKLSFYLYKKDLEAIDAMYRYADEMMGDENEYSHIIYSTLELIRMALLKERLMNAAEEDW